MTLRLPESLHRRLAEAADREGVSLNQYLVYLLAQGSASPYSVRPVPESEVREQQEAYDDLLAALGSATDEELLTALEEREKAASEEGVDHDLVRRLTAKQTQG